MSPSLRLHQQRQPGDPCVEGERDSASPLDCQRISPVAAQEAAAHLVVQGGRRRQLGPVDRRRLLAGGEKRRRRAARAPRALASAAAALASAAGASGRDVALAARAAERVRHRLRRGASPRRLSRRDDGGLLCQSRLPIVRRVHLRSRFAGARARFCDGNTLQGRCRRGSRGRRCGIARARPLAATRPAARPFRPDRRPRQQARPGSSAPPSARSEARRRRTPSGRRRRERARAARATSAAARASARAGARRDRVRLTRCGGVGADGMCAACGRASTIGPPQHRTRPGTHER